MNIELRLFKICLKVEIIKKFIISFVMNKIFCLIFVLISLLSFANAEDVSVFQFTNSELSKLEVRKVRGADNKTVYSVGSNENGNFLKAVADNAASGLGKEIKINLNKTPFINITWRIEKDLSGIKENTKKGHDFAARVFVIKKTERNPSLKYGN